MASRGNSKTRSRRQSFKAWHKRLIAGALTLLSLLVFLSLIYGKESILRDYQQLSYSGHMLSWFFQPYLQTANLIGVFGAVISYILLYLFGYWLSLLGSLLLLVVSLQYFLEPEAHHGRQKSYLLLITAFLLQILFCNPLAEYQHSVIPLFVRKVLYAIFRGPGSSIILVGGIVLSLVLFFEFRRIKQWLAFLREDFARRREARQDSAQQFCSNINSDVPSVF